jgi:uncharacterized protein YbjT (DUF2867 family)
MHKLPLLVIGGSGFIGGRLVAAALATGQETAYTFAQRAIDLPAPAYRVDLTTPNDEL